MPFQIHRIYEAPAPPGYRVLVDRLWPRGVKKIDAGLDEWLKDVAPSTGLRRWYDHDTARFDEFSRRYRDELEVEPTAAAVRHLIERGALGSVILITATRDVEHSGARVLMDHLFSLL